jgi:membrane protein YqaA with SNARE-associated domain
MQAIKKLLNYPFIFIRKIYDWTLHWVDSKHCDYALFAVSFMESSFFPVPPDVLLIPMVVSAPQKWIKKAAICLVGSVLGAYLGYAIGYLFCETIGTTIINFYHIQDAVKLVETKYSQNAFITIFIGAFSPIPYKAMTITAGIFQLNLLTFFIASIVGRGARFFIVAFAIRIFGERVKNSIEKYFNILSIFFITLIVLGIIAFRYL